MSNEVLEEIWKIRADRMRECNYDIHVYFKRMNEFAKTLPPERFAKRPVRRPFEYPAPPVAVPLAAHEKISDSPSVNP
jgi:hypothetical protein